MITLKVPKKIQALIVAATCVSLITGVAFYILNSWITVEGDFGPEKHPWQFSILKIHAASAFTIIILYGAMWGSHVQLGWRSKTSRKSGISLTALLGLQILSAYLLYYLSSDTTREFVAYIHLGIGLSIPASLIIHIITARKRRNARG